MDLTQKMVAIVVVTVTLFYFYWDCTLTDDLEGLVSSQSLMIMYRYGRYSVEAFLVRLVLATKCWGGVAKLRWSPKKRTASVVQLEMTSSIMRVEFECSNRGSEPTIIRRSALV